MFRVVRSPRTAYVCCGIAIIATVVGCAAYYRHLWPDYSSFASYIDPKCKATFCDFRYYYYKQAQNILTVDTPVRKYYYSPTFALLLVPLGRLPLDQALLAWTWVQASSLLLLIVASWLLLRTLPLWTYALLSFLTLTSFPMLHNWKWGQANVTFIAVVVLALALCERGRSKAAAFSLSLVVASRYYPVIYALAFVSRERWKTLAWFAVFAIVLMVVVPAAAMGPAHAWNFYVHSAASIDEAFRFVAKNRAGSYLPSTMLRLTEASAPESGGPREVWTGIALVLAACSLGTAGCVAHKQIAHRRLWCFCFCALSTPLIAPTSWIHYFVYLPLVHTFIASQLFGLRCAWQLRAAGVLLVWLPCAAIGSVFFAHGVGAAYTERGYLLFSDLAMLALSYALLVASWRCAASAASTVVGERPCRTATQTECE